jgi:hypothetical protein
MLALYFGQSILGRSILGQQATSTLTVPINVVRGRTRGSVPVERVEAQVWYRYIQELIAAGQTQEAELHLHRFNQLHPQFVPALDAISSPTP